ncbi:hypothetical protein DID78_03070 [Candidatus Marinamargulisbacteria bacterium SCGC AG-343-D04]|nr:hypothetical protein DID78_03070 [Candidatus Marinamargulisbacteria bacterium SCGC AG-343-D04]
MCLHFFTNSHTIFPPEQLIKQSGFIDFIRSILCFNKLFLIFLGTTITSASGTNVDINSPDSGGIKQ